MLKASHKIKETAWQNHKLIMNLHHHDMNSHPFLFLILHKLYLTPSSYTTEPSRQPHPISPWATSGPSKQMDQYLSSVCHHMNNLKSPHFHSLTLKVRKTLRIHHKRMAVLLKWEMMRVMTKRNEKRKGKGKRYWEKKVSWVKKKKKRKKWRLKDQRGHIFIESSIWIPLIHKQSEKPSLDAWKEVSMKVMNKHGICF